METRKQQQEQYKINNESSQIAEKERDTLLWRMPLSMLAVILIVIAVLFLIFRFSSVKKWVSWIFGIIMPFITGGAIAYVINPFCSRLERILENFLEKQGIRRYHRNIVRNICIFTGLILVIALIVLLFIAIIPEIVSSVMAVFEATPRAIQNFQYWLTTLENEHTYEVINAVNNAITGAIEQLNKYATTDIIPSLQIIFKQINSGVFGALSFFKNIFIGTIVAVYALNSKEKFKAQFKLVIYALFPEHIANGIISEIKFTDRAFSGFIVGKLIDSLIIGLICFIFNKITMMPYGTLIAIVVGVTNIIPVFGPYVGAVPSILLILMESPIQALVFAIFIQVLQLIDGYILGPKILGNSIKLSGFWVLFAIVLFGSLWGIAGMIIGVPVFAVIYDLIRHFIRNKLIKREKGCMLSRYDASYHADKDATTPPEIHIPVNIDDILHKHASNADDGSDAAGDADTGSDADADSDKDTTGASADSDSTSNPDDALAGIDKAASDNASDNASENIYGTVPEDMVPTDKE